MASVSAPANLRDLVHAAFVRARAAGDLLFFPTQVVLVRVQGVPFQLRYAPSLATKPKGPPKPKDAGPFDPFDDPPAGLVVLPRLGAHHRLVLNKFAVCADHAILATTAFRRQDHLLDAGDLAAAWACVEAWADDSNPPASASSPLFVFYNSGPHSGASQPHRHLQLLPVARMREGLAGEEAWGVLVEGDTDNLPFYVASAPLPSTVTPAALHALYLALYRQARVAALTDAAADDDDDEVQGRVPARISYNLALTRRTMAVCPRRAEGGLVDVAGAAAADRVLLSLNGTVLAGTALVKSAAEWTALQQEDGGGGGGPLERVLRTIGVPGGRGASL